MDASTLTLLIVSMILAAAGIAALVAAYQNRVKTLTETVEQQTQLAIRNSQINDIQNRLEITQLELETAVTERNHYKSGIDKITGSLVALGVIHPDSDVLALTQADIIIEHAPQPQRTATQTTPEIDTSQLPLIPDLKPQLVLDALTHAANRPGKRSNRPFSRRYMVDNGPLKHGEYNTLLQHLIENGYLETESSNSPTLTEHGQNLLKLVK